MPIITVETAKRLLKITGTQDDEQIQELIPIVQDWVLNKLNNFFEQNLKVITYKAVFANIDNSVSVPQLDFSEEFTPGMEVRIKGSLRNDGIHTISSVSEEKLVFTSDTVIQDEENSLDVQITWVKFPEGLKVAVAMMIAEDLNLTVRTSDEEYSPVVMRKLKPYMKVYTG